MKGFFLLFNFGLINADKRYMNTKRIAAICFALFLPAALGMAQTEPALVNGFFRQEGIASWYGTEFDGRPTASGEVFNSALFTAAHPSLPFGTMLRITNRHNNRQAVVKVNDRGPFVSSRIIDLSQAAAQQLDMISTGTAPVVVESLEQLQLSTLQSQGAYTGTAAPYNQVSSPTQITAPEVAPLPPEDPPALAQTQPAYQTQPPAGYQPQQPAYQAPAQAQPSAGYQPQQPAYQAPAQAQPSYPAQPPAGYQAQQPAYQAQQPSYSVPAQPAYPAPAQTQPTYPAQPAYPAPAQTQPAYPQSAYPAPTQAQPAYPVQPQSAYPAPAQAQPAYPAQQQAQPAQPPEAQPRQPAYLKPAPAQPQGQDYQAPAQSQTPEYLEPVPAAAPIPVAPAARPAAAAVAVPLPPAEIKPAIPQGGTDKTYRIQVGAYRNPRNAADVFDKLKNVGLNPAYERSGEVYRVVLARVRAEEVPSIAEKLGTAGFQEALIREER
jgi:rare lipoprotein A (peptidoglycan hydrolase)/cell division protein FtsN